MLKKTKILIERFNIWQVVNANFAEKRSGFLTKKPTDSFLETQQKDYKSWLAKLIEKKIDSGAFMNAFQKEIETLENQNHKSLSTEIKKKNLEYSQIVSTLIESPRHLSTKSVLELLSIFHTSGMIENLSKDAVDILLKNIIGVVLRKDISEIQLEIVFSSMNQLLLKLLNMKSTAMFTQLIKTSNYHEIFEQYHIESLENILTEYQKFIIMNDEHIVSNGQLVKFIRLGFSKYKSFTLLGLAYSFRISINELKEFSKNYIGEFYSGSISLSTLPIEYMIRITNAKTSPETWMSYNSNIQKERKLPINSKLEYFIKVLEFQKHFNKLQKKDDKTSDREKLMDLTKTLRACLINREFSAVTSEHLGEVLFLLPRLYKLDIKSTQLVLNIIVDLLEKSPILVGKLNHLELVCLALFLKSYSKNYVSPKIDSSISQNLSPRIKNFDELLVTLTPLLIFGFTPRELISLLPKFDSKERRKLDPLDTLYYIMTYCNLFSISQEFNVISHNGLQNIEDIIIQNHKNLTIEDKCIILMRMKNISSQNKLLYISNELIKSLNNIPQKFFAAIINNIINYSYHHIDKEAIMIAIKERFNSFDYKDLIYIGKSLMWINGGTQAFWMTFFNKLEQVIHPSHLENIPWACDLYQIVYSLERKNQDFTKQIHRIFDEIDFQKLKELYFERPNLPTTEEITKSEADVELYLKKIGVKFQRQQLVGIHRVDFLVKDNIVIEIYGRHHYAEKKLLTAQALWRENQLISLGYKVRGIALQEWNSFGREEKKLHFLTALIED